MYTLKTWPEVQSLGSISDAATYMCVGAPVRPKLYGSILVFHFFLHFSMIFSLSKIIGIHSIHGIHMTTYSEKPLRILGLTVLLSISEHIVPFCPQKVYKRYTSSIHQGRADIPPEQNMFSLENSPNLRTSILRTPAN